MASLAWGGHRNGQIPITALKKISNFVPLAGEPVGPGGAYLMTEAANQWELMCFDAKRATGESPTGSECYRDLPSQQGRYNTYIKNRKPLAAYPGTSNHGWGRSVDIGYGARTWITNNGSKYGFYATVAGEPWHFDYLGNPTIKFSSEYLEEFMAKLDKEDMNFLLNYEAYSGSNRSISQVLKDLDIRSKSIFDAIFTGGASMPDKVDPKQPAGYSLGQSVALIRKAVQEAMVTRTGQDPIQSLTGKPVTRGKVQDDAETNTIVREILTKISTSVPATSDGKPVDVDALVAKLSPAISKAVADTLADRLKS